MSQGQEEIINTQEQQVAQQVSKSNQPTKKLNSYTYWVDQKNKSRQLPLQQRPQKIDPPKLVNKTSQDGRSNWNTAGTWEPKIISVSQIQKQYKQKLNKWVQQNCPQSKLKEVSLKGQCQLIFIRTKKALTYEINGKVEFQKQPQQQKEEQKSQTQPEKVKAKNSSQQQSDGASGQRSSSKSSEKDKKSETQDKDKKPKSKSKSKSKPKAKTMTFEIVDLTDHGDRDYKSKADDADGKKFIAEKSESLLILLEDIIKSYK